ncbi:unnamed protein product [Eruca vesicaria subsp. sativa]|uniref:Uncharacterized protein n=1 Tax=Eruca vesicaria subsp. sativa TaxID=29727 RepID=A0ABC8LM09_ERUVS|nr:unnamed protein product [Eruca vesicaria subsp. sativa]
MNGQEGDCDVYGDISNRTNMERAEDDNIDANAQVGVNINKNIRHTPQQIQKLENFFMECCHPSTEERSKLGQELNLETNQITYWFRNKRAKMKAHEERHENFDLRQENDILRRELEQLKEQLMLCTCTICGGPTYIGLVQQLQEENATLKQQINWAKILLRSLIQIPDSPYVAQPSSSLLLELANDSMNEFIMMGQPNSSLWKIDPTSRKETLDYEEYDRIFINGLVKPCGYVMEASRETGLVFMDCLAIVETLTTNKWINVFEPVVSVASARTLILTSGRGPIIGSLLIEAGFHVISPLVPKRRVKFLRYCKMLKEGLWVVVDFSLPEEPHKLLSDGSSNRLPSGLIIEDMANGYSKVTWIEHTQYERSKIPPLYQLLIGSGIGLGAKRWLTTLQRHCENLWNLSNINLAGVYQENKGQNMRMMSRKNVNVLGESTGIVLSAATSVRFPVNQKTMFDFLNDKKFRSQWDILTDEASIEETTKIQKSRTHNNYVSLLKIFGSSLSVLKETWNDASGALLVFAPLSLDSVEKLMRGEASYSVPILPSGFSIVPDGVETNGGGCLLTIG